MLIRGNPKNIDDYIIVDNETSKLLQRNGFMPKYFDGEVFYYKKNNDIEEFMERSF